MRITHILNHVEEAGNGIVNVAVDLACVQAREGHEVSVLSGGGQYEKLLTEHGVVCFRLEQRRNARAVLVAARNLRKFLSRIRPEIVHVHMVTGTVLAWACQPGLGYHLVGSAQNEFKRSAVLMGLASRVIAPSHAVARSLVRRGVPQARLRTVLNGPLGSPRRAKELRQSADLRRPAIVTVAGLYGRKGIKDVIEAFVKIAPTHPAAHLYLVGEGPDRATFEGQAQKNGLTERIHFEGFQRDPDAYLLSADIFVLASHRDPCPLVILEARAAGCAIVASAVDGIPEALDGGDAGILFKAGDTRALAENLDSLIRDDHYRGKWAQAAKRNVDRFSLDRMARETEAVYQELVSSN